ncbi:hypothetical protein CF327_g3273 [Tilletia walkeri]|nr:hypothetical protein CF327_g3273 [Tilletia walkeri]
MADSQPTADSGDPAPLTTEVESPVDAAPSPPQAQAPTQAPVTETAAAAVSPPQEAQPESIERNNHRQAAPSIGNAASLFGGQEDDFFSSITAGSSLGVDQTAPAAHLPQSDDFFASQTQHTPTQRTVDLPAQTTPAAFDVAADPATDTSASLFGDSTGADDDWLGVGGAAPIGAADDVPGTDSYAHNDSYQQTAEHDSYANSSWDQQQYDGHHQQAQGYDQQQYDQQHYQQQQHDGQYDYSGTDASHQNYDANAYSNSAQGYEAGQYAQQHDQYHTHADRAQGQTQYAQDQYAHDQYAQDPYAASQYQPTDQHASDSYASEQQYASDQYASHQTNQYAATDQYAADQYAPPVAADPYAAPNQYAPVDQHAPNQYAPAVDPYAANQYAPVADPYAANQYAPAPVDEQHSASDPYAPNQYAAPVAHDYSSEGYVQGTDGYAQGVEQTYSQNGYGQYDQTASLPPPPPPAAAAPPVASSNSYSYDAPPATFRSGRKSRGVGYASQAVQQEPEQYNQYAQAVQQEPEQDYQQQQQQQQQYSADSQFDAEGAVVDYGGSNEQDAEGGLVADYGANTQQEALYGGYGGGYDAYDPEGGEAVPSPAEEAPLTPGASQTSDLVDSLDRMALQEEDGGAASLHPVSYAQQQVDDGDPMARVEGNDEGAEGVSTPKQASMQLPVEEDSHDAGSRDRDIGAELEWPVGTSPAEVGIAEQRREATPQAAAGDEVETQVMAEGEVSNDRTWDAGFYGSSYAPTPPATADDETYDPEAHTEDASHVPVSSSSWSLDEEQNAAAAHGEDVAPPPPPPITSSRYGPPSRTASAASTSFSRYGPNDSVSASGSGSFSAFGGASSVDEKPAGYSSETHASNSYEPFGNASNGVAPYASGPSSVSDDTAQGRGGQTEVLGAPYDPYAPPPASRRTAGASAPPPSSNNQLDGSVGNAPYAAGPYEPFTAPAHAGNREFSSEQGQGPYGYGVMYDSASSGKGSGVTVQGDSFGGLYGPPLPSSGEPMGSGAPSVGAASPYQPTLMSADTSMNDSSYFRSAGTETMPDVAEERRRARIPCVAFGVDGKVITYFASSSASPSSSAASESAASFGGFGSPASSTCVQVRSLRSLVAPSSYASVFDPTTFPGPVFEGVSGGALSRATGAGGPSKAKKAAVVSFLRDRAEEVCQGLKYLSRGEEAGGSSADGQRSSDRVVLLRLLALIVEHDGKTIDNPKFDAAARDLLAANSPTDSPATTDAYGNENGFNTNSSSPRQTLATYELTSDFLTELQSKLVHGQRREAVQFALERRMWAHAMVIASGLDKETWCKVVGDFMAFELEQSESGPREGGDVQVKALRTAYSLFSGQSATQVYDAFRPKVSLTSSVALPGSVSAAGWRDSAAAVAANRSAGDSGVLTAMGDGLMLSEFIEAAHVCYLLSPQTSVIGGVDTPGSRATLLGGHNPRASVLYLRDLDSILLTEIYEFAQSLLPAVKGQEAFNGLPHLQAFRLVHAITLAELGDTARAQKYCEAIAATFKSGKPSPYFHPILLAQLKDFTTRLLGPDGAGSTASGSWMAKKMQKPTLDGVWGALEGRFTKFIAGEGGPEGSPNSSQPASKANSAHGGVVGPFSHFSSITADAAGGAAVPSQPASRAGSAMDFRSHRAESPAIRAASALSMRGMQPMHPAIPPAPHTAPRDPYSDWPTSSQSTSSFGAYGLESDDGPTTPSAPSGFAGVNPQNTGSFASSQSSDAGGYEGPYRSHGETSNTPWWGQDSTTSTSTAAGASESDAADTSARGQAPGDAPYYGYQPHGATAPQFFSNVEPPSGEVGAGFVSPMDAYSRPASREPSYGAPSSNRFDEEPDEEDDLGLGNKSSRQKKENADQGKGKDDGKKGNSPAKGGDDGSKTEALGAKKPELRPSASTSSWLGRFWGRGAAEPENKPKKVHLGEETSFYYDKDLKRWVNKTSGGGDSSATAASSTPPPPRAQTASPSVQNGRLGPPSAPRSSLDHTLQSSSSTGFLRAPPSAPPIAEESDSFNMGGPPSSSVFNRGVPAPPRTRSNLGDPNIPAASQPPMRPPSAMSSAAGAPPHKSGSAPPMSMGSPGLGGPPMAGTPPPPPGGARAGGAKKKPIKARYVVVD